MGLLSGSLKRLRLGLLSSHFRHNVPREPLRSSELTEVIGLHVVRANVANPTSLTVGTGRALVNGDVDNLLAELDGRRDVRVQVAHAELVAAVADADGRRAAARLRDAVDACLLYTSPSPRDKRQSRMPSSA